MTKAKGTPGINRKKQGTAGPPPAGGGGAAKAGGGGGNGGGITQADLDKLREDLLKSFKEELQTFRQQLLEDIGKMMVVPGEEEGYEEGEEGY
jgi:hypothetical protein